MDNLGVVDATTENFLHSNVVNLELTGTLWNRVKAGFGDEVTEQVFEAKLLG